MLSQVDNERITRTGPGTQAGQLLRSYWQPVALVEELPDDRPAIPVKVMGEDLVLFRRADGGYSLIGRWCSHRGVDLSFGRLEGDGLRCLYHGWLYGPSGECLEQPAEPPGSRFKEKIRHTSYPCKAVNGLVMAYLGGGPPPMLPEFDCFAAPEEYTFAYKGLWDCNWLQGLEGGIDPSHVSYLHRFISNDPREAYGQQFRSTVDGTDAVLSELVGENIRPTINVEETDFGLRVYAIRELENHLNHVRITNLLFPNAFVIPFSDDIVLTQWHVPIDDTTHYWYMILFDFMNHTDKKVLREQRAKAHTFPDYRPVRNRENNWGFDAQEQSTLTYTGMGLDINVHDQWAVESMGPIQDRTREHLGVSDRAVTAYRRQLLKALEAPEGSSLARGTDGRNALPVAVDLALDRDNWEDWRRADERRRIDSPWADAYNSA